MCKNKNILIVGGGGFGREMVDWINDYIGQYNLTVNENSPTRYTLKGFLDDNPLCLDGFNLDIQVVGNVDTYNLHEDDRFVLAIGDIATRIKLQQKLDKKGAKFISIVHPTSIVSPSSYIGKGVVVAPFCLVSSNARIEDFSLLNFYSSVAHDAKLGPHCVLSPYSTVNGFVKLAGHVFLGTHAIVSPGVEVGFKSIISTGTAVMKTVPEKKFVEGIPGRVYPILW